MPDSSTILAICPHCRRRYRVRSEHVPPQGVRARCPHCRAVFAVVPRVAPGQPPGPAAARALAPGSASEPAPAATGVSNAGSDLPAPRPSWSSDLERNRPARGPIGEIRPRSVDTNGAAEPVPAVESGDGGEGGEDAHAHARILARALASDLAAYHPEECRQGRDTARLVSLMAAEIARSWQLYSREVGGEIAGGTSYFRDALNECLAGGEPYF